MTDSAKLSVKDWSPEDRPREKLLTKGVNTLSNAELLAIILRSGTKDETVVELSQRILQSFENDLNRLGKISADYLMSNFKGIGEAKAIGIIAALELGKRRKAEEASRKKIICSLDIYNYFYPFLCDLQYEEFWALFLNRSSRIIDRFKVSQGGTSETIVDGKLVYKEALTRLASFVVLCHNHPSGNHLPSSHDNTVTHRIKAGLELIDMRLVDHVILTDGKYYSYADEGKIS
ncbi:MAG: DNA repair protein RadC [Candidatus Azobacteroides sp.]|nr:DNA repair protein RadC [Candidatus Azobacteroides sp.]